MSTPSPRTPFRLQLLLQPVDLTVVGESQVANDDGACASRSSHAPSVAARRAARDQPPPAASTPIPSIVSQSSSRRGCSSPLRYWS